MITAAFQWAASKNLVRRNPVHKDEEARLIIGEDFELLDETGQEVRMEGSVELEDRSATCTYVLNNF